MEQKTDLLVGRKAEREQLDSIVESRESEFVVVYGRMPRSLRNQRVTGKRSDRLDYQEK